jgi:hypothetical protein
VLGLVDDPLLDLPRLDPRLLAGGLDLFAALVDRGCQGFQACPQPVQVTEAVGVRHGAQQPLHGRLRLGGGDLGRGDALLDQRDLSLQRRELAPEELKRLLRLPAAHEPITRSPSAVRT